MPEATVAIVEDADLTPTEKLAAALDRAGLWDILQRAAGERISGQCKIIIKPELAGFALGSPTVTDPTLVEELIDQLHDRGFADVAIVGAADSSTLWAENRDLYALSDLLGYRFATSKDRPYEILDLTDAIETDVFPADTVLHGSALSQTWRNADVRIVFSKNRTDEAEGYALCLDTLLGVLPLADKNLHYRRRRHPGDVIAALLAAVPVDFCLIDAVVSGHGAGGRRAPRSNDTGTIIAASDIVLADHVGAMKMGLDPRVSPVYSRVISMHPLPNRFIVAGSLAPYPGWENVPPLSLQATRLRGQSELLDRLVSPWLQQLDPSLFPFKQPLDARLNSAVTDFFATSSGAPVGEWLLMTVNAVLGGLGRAATSYQTLFDKDSLRQQSVTLGFDPKCVSEDAFSELVKELHQLELLAAEAPQASDELRWCYVGQAVVFQYTKRLPVNYQYFTERIDIARTIQFMNDYLGGLVVPLLHDDKGRPVRQAERNIYLPQPNYLVLYDGKPIDVSKLEVVEYDDDCQRLYWKTVHSENGSATYDDGIASFERAPDGTRITIVGRQQFTLPPFWQMIDLDKVPAIKATLVTHAYRTFFDRTIANFEALIEGREIRIGRPVDEAAPAPMEQLMPVLQRIAEVLMPLIQRFMQGKGPDIGQASQQTDEDGFVHVTPAPDEATQLSATIEQFIRGLDGAVKRDLAQQLRSA